MSDTSLVFSIIGRDRTGPALNSASNGLSKLKVAAVAGFGGVAAAIGSSVKKAADFDQQIRIAGTAMNGTAADMKSLSDLALQMGSKTQFGAQGAADAMVELAKGGMTIAQIKAGALAGTMTLASAGGLELGDAATYMINALSTFGLQASDAASTAAALAGGANASTASVESLGLALQQVGPGAKNAGLSLQETVAVLADFDYNGIKGSDAGTSLKTMLTRLVPTTKQAKDEMKKLGLSFVDAKGSFLPITQIAQQLQDKFKGMSEAQKVAALSTIFGSDATRAASILMKEGAKGLETYIKATKDQTAAQKMADAQTQGAAGNFKKFHAAVDSLQIAFGLKLLPTITRVTGKLTDLINKVTGKVNPVMDRLSNFVKKDLAPAFGTLKDAIGKAFDKLDFSKVGDSLKSSAQTWAGSLISGVQTGLDNGNWGPLGSSLGKGLAAALKNVGTGALDLTAFIRRMFGNVDWFNVGKAAVGGTLSFALGFVSSLLDPAVWWNVVRHHLVDVALIVLTVFTDGFGSKFITKLGARLEKGGFVGKIVGKLLSNAPGAVQKIVSFTASLAGKFGEGILKGIRRFFPEFGKATGSAIRALIDGVRSRYIGLRLIISGAVDAMVSGLKALPGKFASAMGDAFGSLLGAAGRGAQRLDGFMGGIPGRIIGVFRDAGSWLVQAGKDIMGGLVSGIKSAAMSPVNAVIDTGKGIISGFKKKLGIQSPSRVMLEVGKNIIDGLTSGVKSKQADALSAVKDLVQQMKDKLQTIKDFAAQIKDSFIATADLTSITGSDQSVSFNGMIGKLQRQAAQAAAFSSAIGKLRNMGLNETTIRQLRDAGPEASMDAINNLLSGGQSGVNQVNELVKQIIGTGEKFAGSEAKNKYGINPYKSQPVTVKAVHSKVTIDFTNKGAENALVEAIRGAVRKRGGDVQVVLGKK